MRLNGKQDRFRISCRFPVSAPMMRAAALAGMAGIGLTTRPPTAAATTVTLIASDASGSTSFNTAGHWSNSLAPSGSYDYAITGDLQMRTPPTSGNQTFAGNSLTLGAGTNTSYGILTCKASDATGDVITVNNLTMNDAVIQDGGTPGGTALTWTLAGSNMVVGAGGFTIDNGGTSIRNVIVAGNLTGTGGLVGGINHAVSINAGSVCFAGNNSAWSGPELISGGTVYVGNGTSGSLGTGPVDNDGTLAFNLSSAYSASNAISSDSGSIGYIQNIGGGTVVLSGAVTNVGQLAFNAGTITANGPVTNTGTLNISNGATTTFGGTISGTGPVLVAGSSSLTLSGTNTYTGLTNISSGTLYLHGGAITASNILVGSGATFDVTAAPSWSLGSSQTLSGTGNINGNFGSGGTISPGTGSTVGTLTFNNNLSLTGGTLVYALNGSSTSTGGGTNDLIAVDGNLTLTGATILSVSPSTTPAVGSVYTLITYNGTLTGSASNFIAASRSVKVDLSTPGEVNLDYTSGLAANLTWSAAAGSSAAWDVVSSLNWYNNGTAGGSAGADRFYQGDNVTFDDSRNPVPTTVAINTTVLPGSILVNSSSNNYTFTGTGTIGGSTGLTKSGPSTLTIANANTYSGDTSVNGGTLVVTNSTGTALGTGTVNIASGAVVEVGTGGATGILTNANFNDNGLLVYNSSSQAFFGTIGGTGALSLAGSGNLIFTAANSYSGGTTVTAGVLVPEVSGAMGTGLVTVTGGGNVNSFNNSSFANNFNISGVAIHTGGQATTVISGNVTLLAPTTINLDGSSTLSVTGSVSSAPGTNASITAVGGGTLSFSGPVSLGTGQIIDGSIVAFADSMTTTIVAPITDYTTTTATGTTTTVGTVVVDGPSTTILSGNNTYSGITYVYGGVLQLGSNTALGASSGTSSYTFIEGGNTAGTAVSAYVAFTGGINTAESFVLGGRAGTSVAAPEIDNISGNNTITGTINTTTGGNNYIIESDSGTLTITGNYVPNGPTGARYLDFQGAGNGLWTGLITDGTAVTNVNSAGPGTWNLSAASTYSGATNVNGGTLVFGIPVGATGITVNSRPGGINVAAGATLVLGNSSSPATRQVLVTPNLSLASNSLLDVGSNDMDLSGASLSQITSLVAQGYNLTGGGNWNGTGGITSSAAANTAHLTALGVIQNNQDGTQIYGNGVTFDGTNPGASDILVKYTYFGDANLDGKVDGSDYSLIDAGYASNGALTGWLNGDFNYDGVIDGSDYALIDNAFNNQNQTVGPSALVAAETAQVAGVAAPVSAVPEPASIGLAVVAAAALAGRRRRRN